MHFTARPAVLLTPTIPIDIINQINLANNIKSKKKIIFFVCVCVCKNLFVFDQIYLEK